MKRMHMNLPVPKGALAMNIGIIVFSQTGHTLSVAEKIQATCTAAGHTAEIAQITIQEQEKSDSPVVLRDVPDTTKYDLLLLGAPVQAFSLCRAMVLYLKQVESLKGVPAGGFFTQGLPKLWMGGNRAWKQFRSHCLHRGADPVRLGHVHWKSEQRDEQIADIVTAAVKFVSTMAPKTP